jgi:DNA-binding transcriptional LysR family regulator
LEVIGLNFEDIKKILHLVSTQNIQESSVALNITSGALSKTLKKVEQQLNTQLFDRVGRNLQINHQGKKFADYGAHLVHEYEQMCSEFNGRHINRTVNISGPAVLLNHCLNRVVEKIPALGSQINIDIAYEGDALKRLEKAQTNIAIVTNDALISYSPDKYEVIPLGVTTFKIAVSAEHPILNKPSGVTTHQLLEFPFACPTSSPFCGIARGVGSDGWPDKQHPRNIAFRSDDYNTIIMLIKSGHAIGYVPDILIESNHLNVVELSDFNYNYNEPYSFVYKRSLAYGWLNSLADKLK